MTLQFWSPSPSAVCEGEASARALDELRVLYLQPSPLFGGAERQLTSISPFLHQQGVRVLALVGPGQVIVDWFSEQSAEGVVRTSAFPGQWDKLRGLGRLTIPFRYLSHGVRARAEMLELVRKHDIDVILASLPFAWITGSLAARAAGIPIIWRAGGIGPSPMEKRMLSWVAPHLLPDLLLCNAQSVLDVFGPLVPAPALVIPNGVDHRVFHPDAGNPQKYRPADAELVVGAVMRLAPSKRPQDFIQLAARLRNVYPKARFLLAGDGSSRRELESLALQLGADNLRFLGFVSDVQSFYRACDVLVLPSSSEGSPNFVLEGMAMEKPLALASIAPLLELVKRENALWFELGNVDQLTERVSLLLSSGDVRDLLAKRAQLRASSFTLSECAERLAETLRAVAARTSGPPATYQDEKAAE